MKVLTRVLLLALTLLAVGAPSAFAADPPGTADDCTVAGKSVEELRAMLASPATNVYCPGGTVDEVEEEIAEQEGGGVAGAGDNTPPAGGETAQVSGSNLPFTGAEMGTFAVLGALLVLTGLVLRRTGGSDPTS